MTEPIYHPDDSTTSDPHPAEYRGWAWLEFIAGVVVGVFAGVML